MKPAGNNEALHGHETNMPPMDHDATDELQGGVQEEDGKYVAYHTLSHSKVNQPEAYCDPGSSRNKHEKTSTSRVDRDAMYGECLYD